MTVFERGVEMKIKRGHLIKGLGKKKTSFFEKIIIRTSHTFNLILKVINIDQDLQI